MNIYRIIALIVILLITYVTFLPVLDCGFTNWDDQFYVLENYNIRDISFQGIKNIFDSKVLGHYHPLTILSYGIEYSLYRLIPKYFHLDNLILHLLNTSLVYWIVILYSKKMWPAVITALLFAIHPMHVESVAWISERKGLLSALFFLGALVSYIYYLRTESTYNKLYWTALVFFILALLAKAAVVFLPVVLLLLDFVEKQKIGWKQVKEKVPFFVLAFIFGVLALKSQDSAGALQVMVTKNITYFDRVLFASNNLMVYLIKAFIPYKISCLYPYPQKTAGTLPLIYYSTPLAVVMLIFIVYKFRKSARAILFGGVFFLVSIGLFLQLIPVGDVIMADRYTYLPYIGLFLIIGIAVDQLIQRKRITGYVILGLLFVYTFYLSAVSYERCKIWKDSGSLWTDVINNYPEVSLAYNNRSKIFIEEEKYNLAIQDYNMALKLNPANYDAYNNRGNVYSAIGKYELAIRDYTQAIHYKRNFAYAYSNRSQCYYEINDFSNALKDALKAQSLGVQMKTKYIEWLKEVVSKMDKE